MPGTRSVVAAEQRAMDGNNESQDSEQVLELYQSIYGVGLMSSSPPHGDEPPFPHKSHHHVKRPSHALEGDRRTRQTRGGHAEKSMSLPLPLNPTEDASIDNRDFVRSLPSDICSAAHHLGGALVLEAEGPSERPAEASIDIPASDQAQPGAQEALESELLVPDALVHGLHSAAYGKMDVSQSPTQSNDGRSYDRYFPASQRSDKLAVVAYVAEQGQANETFSQSSIHEQRSLSEDDTGAVVFDIDNAVTTHTSHSMPSDHSPQPALAAASARTFALQQQTLPSQEHLPETPAVRHNPFAGINQVQLLPTSQLFKATQFSSALRRGASPTSSRPSPNDFPHNTISPDPNSSPLKARGMRSSPTTRAVSSPQAMHVTDSPPLENEQATPFHTASPEADDPVVPESPQYRGLKARPAPMDVYVPMRQSQERRSSSLVPLGAASPELSADEDDPIDRRRRARSKKEAALKQLTSIKITRTPRSESVEVPSTNTKKKTTRPTAQRYIDQRNGSQAELPQGLESQERVENSQNALTLLEVSRPHAHEDPTQSSQGEDPVPAENGIARSSGPLGEHNQKRRRGVGPLLRLDSTETNVANSETIPETSPVDKAPKHVMGSPVTPFSMNPKPSSAPVVVGWSRSADDLPKSSVTEFVPPATASETVDHGSGHELPKLNSSSFEDAVDKGLHEPPATLPRLLSETPVALPSSPPAPAFSTRSKTRKQHDEHMAAETPSAPSSKELLDPNTSMSTLSTLSATPSLNLSRTTPDSQASGPRPPARAETMETPNSSPSGAKSKRRRIADLPRLKTHSATDSLRVSRRLSRQQPIDSTDELAKSPSVASVSDHNARGPPRKSTLRSNRTSTADFQLYRDQSHRRPGKLFDGMAFAISFQSQQPGEDQRTFVEREKFAESLGSMITQAGGRVLENGFIELFQGSSGRSMASSPSSSTAASPTQAPDGGAVLTAAAGRLGFTALIADGHSRKAKYMQALALGLPCIAARWITTCLDHGEIVDWAPYLLCAGESTILGGAYKSRVITPYDALGARLSHVVESRPRLLDGSSILLVMNKAEEANGKAYVFLARVLGATICRVHSIDEARAKMKAFKDMGESFDWVYARAGNSSVKAGGNSRKRKRGGGNTTPTVGILENVRTLTDEWVIQSLILGRLLQEGEM